MPSAACGMWHVLHTHTHYLSAYPSAMTLMALKAHFISTLPHIHRRPYTRTLTHPTSHTSLRHTDALRISRIQHEQQQTTYRYKSQWLQIHFRGRPIDSGSSPSGNLSGQFVCIIQAQLRERKVDRLMECYMGF